jgi:uncharacterized repeat protein (TIGR03803 family)
MDATGNLYGTARAGGASINCPGGCGIVFKLSKSGNETVLHSFAGPPTDGEGPEGGLMMDTAGNLYGTTLGGGAYGGGTAFKIDTSGNETVLYSFNAYATDGRGPYAGLIMDTAGNLYGTTELGGASSNCTFGCGTVFKLDASGNETLLYSFAGPPNDGATPTAGLIMDKAGNLYGTTAYGGPGIMTCSLGPGCGTVFKLDTSGNETVLHEFTGLGTVIDGVFPWGGLTMDTEGNLYGTSLYGGTSGQGTVFKFDTSGNEIVLHSFSAGDGENLFGGLLVDTAGNLYGTAANAGPNGEGTVFKLDSSGNETVLHGFPGGAGDGGGPLAGVIVDASGNLYGTTSYGGTTGAGVVFRIALGPGAQVANLETTVNALVSTGTLNAGTARILLAPLNAAIAALNAGRTPAAILELDGFVLEVRLLVVLRRLTPAEGGTLINDANSIITTIRG